MAQQQMPARHENASDLGDERGRVTEALDHVLADGGIERSVTERESLIQVGDHVLQAIAEDNMGLGIDTDEPGLTIRSGRDSLQCQPASTPEVHGSASWRHRQRGSEVLVAFRSEHTATISVGAIRLRDQLPADQSA
jgi:hypothetical protein